MTETEVRSEVQDCGLDHLSTTRVDRFINFAARAVYNTHLWPFRLTTQSGTSPLTVTNRGTIKFVKDADGLELFPADQDELSREVDLTTTTGDASNWYLDDDGDVTIYPATAESITVRHYRAVPTTTEDILEAIPESFHYLVVAGAVRRGKVDNGEFEAAASYKADYDEGLAEMKRVLFNEHVQRPTRRNDF